MESPQESRTPAQTIAKTIDWLDAGHAGAPQAPAARRRPAHVAMKLLYGGNPIEETPLVFDGELGGLFGVAEPVAASERAPVCAVLLNGGALRHTGPSRAWVELARRWAARGVQDGAARPARDRRCRRRRARARADASFYAPETHRADARDPRPARRAGPAPTGSCSAACARARTGRCRRRWPTHASGGALMINLYSVFWSAALVAERRRRDRWGACAAAAGGGWSTATSPPPRPKTALAASGPASCARAPASRWSAPSARRSSVRLTGCASRAPHGLMLFSRRASRCTTSCAPRLRSSGSIAGRT